MITIPQSFKKGTFMKIYKYKGHRIRASDKHLVYHYCIGTLLYDKQIEVLQQKMLELIEESAGKQTADEDFDKEYRVIANQMKALKRQRAKKLKERQLADAYEQRVKDMEQYMKKAGYLKREFDDELVRRLLKTVRVINENKIEIQFQSGIMITQKIDFNV